MNILQRIYYELIERNSLKLLIIPPLQNEMLLNGAKPIKWFIIYKLEGQYYGFSSGPLRSINHYFNKKVKDGDNIEKCLYIRNKEIKLYLKKIKKKLELISNGKPILYTFFDEHSLSFMQFKNLIYGWRCANIGINKFIIFSNNERIIKVKL